MKRSSSKSAPVALSIAASDSSGGAGIQADLKTFAAIGVYGASVLTAITVQDTKRVYEIKALPPELVERQLRVVLDDLAVDSVKIGVVYSPEIASVVADALGKQRLPIVLDPVFRAGSGDPLILDEAKEILISRLIPLSTVVTPNLAELEEISGATISSLEGLEAAAEVVIKLGATAVLAKGFECAPGRLADVLRWLGGRREYQKLKLPVEPHGAGCSLSSAIAAFIAKGSGLVEAVDRAEAFIEGALRSCLKVGGGRWPVDPLASRLG